MKLGKRRQFIQLMGIGSAVVALGDWGRKSLAASVQQNPGVIFGPPKVSPELLVPPEETVQLLLNELETAKFGDILSSDRFLNGKVSPVNSLSIGESVNTTTEAVQVRNSLFSKEIANKTFEEVDAVLESLNQVFYFDQNSGQLTKNPSIALTTGQDNVVQQLVNGFNQQLKIKEISLKRQSDNLFVPVSAESELTFTQESLVEGVKGGATLEEDFLLGSSAQLSCNWQWSRRLYWWGMRVTINRCALDRIRLLIGGGATAAGIASAFGFPLLVAAALVAVVAILDYFSNDNGVRIYITWVGVVIRITGA